MALVTVHLENGTRREFPNSITRVSDRENYVAVLSFVQTRTSARESRPIAFFPMDVVELIEIDWSQE